MYHEKYLTAGKMEEAPAQNAMTSVNDVIVMAIPLCLMVFPMRVSMSPRLDVSAKPDNSTNISSIPIPRNKLYPLNA